MWTSGSCSADAYSRTASRGAAALMAVLFGIVLSAGALAAWHVLDDTARRRAEHAETGRVFALWLTATHRASMRDDYGPALEADPDGFAMAPAGLAGAPPGLPEPGGMTLGIMDDGNGVPMAWAVLVVPDGARGAARAGAFAAGLVAVGVAGEAGGAMSVHEAAIGTARGTAIPAGALFVTADLALPHDEDALYRRAQPGRPWANRMEVELDLGRDIDAGVDGNDLVNADRVDGLRAETTGGVEARDGGSVAGDVTAQAGVTVSDRPDVPGTPEDESQDALLEAGEIEAETGFVASGLVNAGSARIAGRMTAGTVVADRRIDAGSVATVGPVDAGLLVVGTSLTGVTMLTSAAGLDARELVAGGTLDSGPVNVRTFATGSLNAGGMSGGSVAVTGAVFGPHAHISGTMTVGSCDGC